MCTRIYIIVYKWHCNLNGWKQTSCFILFPSLSNFSVAQILSYALSPFDIYLYSIYLYSIFEHTHTYINTQPTISIFSLLFFLPIYLWMRLIPPGFTTHTEKLFPAYLRGRTGHTYSNLWVQLSLPEEEEEKIFRSGPITNSRRAGQMHFIWGQHSLPEERVEKNSGLGPKTSSRNLSLSTFSLLKVIENIVSDINVVSRIIPNSDFCLKPWL